VYTVFGVMLNLSSKGSSNVTFQYVVLYNQTIVLLWSSFISFDHMPDLLIKLKTVVRQKCLITELHIANLLC